MSVNKMRPGGPKKLFSGRFWCAESEFKSRFSKYAFFAGIQDPEVWNFKCLQLCIWVSECSDFGVIRRGIEFSIEWHQNHRTEWLLPGVGPKFTKNLKLLIHIQDINIFWIFFDKSKDINVLDNPMSFFGKPSLLDQDPSTWSLWILKEKLDFLWSISKKRLLYVGLDQ